MDIANVALRCCRFFIRRFHDCCADWRARETAAVRVMETKAAGSPVDRTPHSNGW